MKVIITQDIKGLGRKFDVKNVADGYAINWLLPRGFAREATDSALKQVESERVRLQAEEKVQEELMLKNLSSIEGKQIHLSAKANEQGHLFASIHVADIVARLKDELHIDVKEQFIKLDHPLKTVGDHMIEVSVQDKKAKLKVSISKED